MSVFPCFPSIQQINYTHRLRSSTNTLLTVNRLSFRLIARLSQLLNGHLPNKNGNLLALKSSIRKLFTKPKKVFILVTTRGNDDSFIIIGLKRNAFLAHTDLELKVLRGYFSEGERVVRMRWRNELMADTALDSDGIIRMLHTSNSL